MARATQRVRMRSQFAGKSVAELKAGLVPQDDVRDDALLSLACPVCGVEIPLNRAQQIMFEVDGGALYFDKRSCVPTTLVQLKKIAKKAVRRLL